MTALRIVFSVMPAIRRRRADSQHVGARNRERRGDRGRRGHELHQLVEMAPMGHGCAALPLLHLLSRDAELRAKDALRHAQLGPQIEDVDRGAFVLPHHRAQPRRVASLRRPQALFPAGDARPRHAERAGELRARAAQRLADPLDVIRLKLVDLVDRASRVTTSRYHGSFLVTSWQMDW